LYYFTYRCFDQQNQPFTVSDKSTNSRARAKEFFQKFPEFFLKLAPSGHSETIFGSEVPETLPDPDNLGQQQDIAHFRY